MANQTLNNLKKIHELQKEGSILELLREVRTAKGDVDSLSKRLIQQRKNIEIENALKAEQEARKAQEAALQKQEVEKVQAEVKSESVALNVTESKPENSVTPAFSDGQKPSNTNYRKFENEGSNNNRFNQSPRYNNNSGYANNANTNGNNYRRDNNQGQRNTGTYNQYNNQNGNTNANSRYNNGSQSQGYQGNNRYNNNGYNNTSNNTGYRTNQGYNQNGYNNQNRYQGQGQAQGNRPFNNRPNPTGYNNGGYNNRSTTQTGPKKFGSNNFVSTKVNNFRSFSDTPEIEVKPERNYVPKSKFKSTPQDDKKSRKSLGGDDQKRNNILIEDENGIEEVSFGSRKSIMKKRKEVQTVIAPAITHAVITSKEITIKELSEKIGKPVSEIVKKLMLLGIMATINSSIDFDTAELISSEFGITLELRLDKTFEEKMLDSANETDDQDKLVKRPPVIAVMGHVDHGKTSLLDALRKTNVVAGEAGGITQKIGAYQISFNGEKITFIDTPGHAAFTAMRARGAQATDIAILVVAADDGIMPQTVEAINHIKAAKVPMIVAINKMDKGEANPDRIKQQLAEHDVLPEEWGGDAVIVPISAKTGLGMDELKKMILLVAEIQDLKANPEKMASGVVIEAELDKNRGPVASVLVQNGTLHVGDSIMSGLTYGKVRAMFNDAGKSVKMAGPSTPVQVLGFNEVPQSGDQVYAVEESLSKQVIQERISKIKSERSKQSSGVTLDNFMNKVHEGTLKNLNIIIKADTIGSVEALKSSLLSIQNEEAKVNVVHSGAGAITESDVILAETTGSIIICFNQKPVPKAKQLADSLKIQTKEYKIIYEVVDDITAAINGMMSIKYEEKWVGMAEIRMVFKLSTNGKIAGSYIKEGKAGRNNIAKVMRGEECIGETTVDSLKIVKDEKAEIAKGFECGIKLHDNIDFKEGDTIEFFVKEAIKR